MPMFMGDMRSNKTEVEFYRKVNQQLVQKDKLIRNLQKKLDDLQARLAPPRTVDDEGHEVELELAQLERELMMSVQSAIADPPEAPAAPESGPAPAPEAPAAPESGPAPAPEPPPAAAGEAPQDDAPANAWDAFLATPCAEPPAPAAVSVPEPGPEPDPAPGPAPATPTLSIVVPRPAPEPAPEPPPIDSDAEASAYAAALTQRARRKLEHLRSMAEADSDAEVLAAALRLYEWYLWRTRQGYRLQLIGEEGVREVDLLL